MTGPIEEFVAELARRLPDERHRRFLREAEDHLRDRRAALLAAGVPPAEADRRAVEEFGTVDEVVARLAWESGVRATRWATTLALVSLVLLLLPLYLIPENTFGPAQWAAKPTSVAVTQFLALAVWFVALAVCAAAVAAAALERPRAAEVLLAAAVALGLATGVAVVVAGAVWLEHAPWTPLSSALGLVIPATIVLIGVAAGALAWTRARRPLLETG